MKIIRSSKSTGLADIPTRLLKDGSGAIARPLSVLRNRSLAEDSIPLEWKHATVTPVHKSDSRTNPANYRPISVLPVFSKILEREVHKMAYTFLQQHNLLSVYQSGFRSSHSTTTYLTDVTNTLLQNIDKGQLTGLVFLDLTKAFDTPDHSVLLDKLASLGFSKASVQCFKAYFTDRTQSVVVNGSTSDPQSTSFGVPQGSLIGPLLFIIYINDVPSEVKHCQIQLYANDTLLYVSSSSISDIESMLSEDLKHKIEWLNNNFLYLNYSKTKVMFTGTHQRLALVDSFTVGAGDTVLSRVYQFKYLGVMLDPHLSWNDYIDYIERKISSKLGMLRQ